MAPITPIFLLSLPRSGSTLLQRLLAVDDAIATATEPWLVLPLVYARRSEGCVTHYSHWRSIIAHEDFAKSLPNGEEDYRDEIAQCVLRLYRKAAGAQPAYFLDKTPRYSLIAEDLLELFPDAKFIYLWRNPIAVAASMMQTWAGGRWNLDDYRVDFYQGLPRMIQTLQANGDRIHAVRYEQLLQDPHTILSAALRFLDRPYDTNSIKAFDNVHLGGRFGDQTGVKAYCTLSDEPLDKWKALMGNSIRRRWAQRYLQWLGRERLAVMGYSLDSLLEELRRAPRTHRFLFSDAWRRAGGVLNAQLEWELLRGKRQRAVASGPAISHS